MPYSLPLSSRSRTLSSLGQQGATFDDPLAMTSKQLSQRPARRAYVQGTTHELVLAEQQQQQQRVSEEEEDPFHSFLASVLRANNSSSPSSPSLDDEPTTPTTFSPASSTSSASSSRFDSFSSRPSYDEPENITPHTTPATSACPTRSNSDEGLSCSSTPVDSAALLLQLAQLDLNARESAASNPDHHHTAFPSSASNGPSRQAPSARTSSPPRYPFPAQHPPTSASSRVNTAPAGLSLIPEFFSASPSLSRTPRTSSPPESVGAHISADLQRVRCVSLPQRSASEPDIHHSQPPHLTLQTESKSLNQTHRRVSEASVKAPSSASSSGSDRGTLSPTTPTFSPSSATFLEEPTRNFDRVLSSPNKRRLALPKVDSSNLAAPGAPVRECLLFHHASLITKPRF